VLEFKDLDEGLKLIVDERHAIQVLVGRLGVRFEDRHDAVEKVMSPGEECIAHFFIGGASNGTAAIRRLIQPASISFPLSVRSRARRSRYTRSAIRFYLPIAINDDLIERLVAVALFDVG